MDKYEKLIRMQIKIRYGSIDKFAKAIDVPRTTINSVLKNGIYTSNYGLINKIFNALNISHISNIPIVLDPLLLNLINKYNHLDDYGKHTVRAVAETEFRRITKDPIVLGFGGLTDAKPFTKEEIIIRELVEKIREK